MRFAYLDCIEKPKRSDSKASKVIYKNACDFIRKKFEESTVVAIYFSQKQGYWKREIVLPISNFFVFEITGSDCDFIKNR